MMTNKQAQQTVEHAVAYLETNGRGIAVALAIHTLVGAYGEIPATDHVPYWMVPAPKTYTVLVKDAETRTTRLFEVGINPAKCNISEFSDAAWNVRMQNSFNDSYRYFSRVIGQRDGSNLPHGHVTEVSSAN